MPRINVEISEEVMNEITARAKAMQAAEVALAVKERSIRKTPEHHNGYPISYNEWMRTHPDGKQFMQDCMNFRFRDLPPKDLASIGRQLYHDSFPDGPCKVAKMESKLSSISDLRQKILGGIITREFTKPESKLQLVVSNKTK
jgi:hypothetical protein